MTAAWPRNEFGPYVAFDDLNATCRALRIGPSDRVLEVGGAANAFPRANVVCDLTFGGTEQRNGAPGTFTEGVRYVEAPVESLPFDDGAFDFVICRQVLEHVADPARAAAELARVAKRGLVEVPSRAGELVNGNPTHRWIVDREGDVLVFHRRGFVEHPFDNLFYGRLFQDADLRERAEGRYRNLFNHQVAFEGRLQVRVVEDGGATPFDYDDPVQAGRSHYAFARNCLRQGADPTYALADARAAVRLLPGDPRPRVLLAVYLLRLLELDEADAALEGLGDNASTSLRRLIARVRAGEALDLRTLPVPDPLDPLIAASTHSDRPKVSFVVPVAAPAGARAAVESALAQDYPDVEVVVALAGEPADLGAELAHLREIPRVTIVPVPGRPSLAALLNAGLQRSVGNVLGFVIPPDRLHVQHADRIIAGLLASGADAAHGDRLLLDGGGVLAPDLDPGNPAAVAAFSLSTLILRALAGLRFGGFDVAHDSPVAVWLAEFKRRFRVTHVPLVTVDTPGPAPAGTGAIDAARAQMRLRALDLYREMIALHAQNLALSERLGKKRAP